MLVHEMMTQSVCTVSKDTSIMQVAQLMCEQNVGSLPVVEDKVPVGIITDRDIVCRSLAKGENPCEHCAEDYMTGDLIMVRKDADIHECLDLMEQYQVRRMLVVDAQNQLCGIVAQADIARETTQAETHELLERVSV